MKIAAVHWNDEKYRQISDYKKLLSGIKKDILAAKKESCELVVFPGFLGSLYEELGGGQFEEYIDEICKLSLHFSIAICPGSFWERCEAKKYHASCIIDNGVKILNQRQIYLARWEKEKKLDRGVELKTCQIGGLTVGLMVSTDSFYPQVARGLAQRGCDLVISPIGYIGYYNEALQISGVYQKVQQNLFFAIESGYNGALEGISFWGDTGIYAPLPMTYKEQGFMGRAQEGSKLILADLNQEERMHAIKQFDVLAQLNPDCYCQMKMYGGEK
ncbi:carbon-nitrogen hydrolase family protein [Proteinivorax hydrogeniformans]|uniref:Carbon-nitrogen hydrolase family protein n=1 Tax=Proteinivorax hydrogeniformans TaxID=1826727 RepID=A0AAU8HQ02_9FIRM